MAGMTWPDAARLVRCTGFGATGAAVDAVAGRTAADVVAAWSALDPVADPGVAATPVPTFDPVAPRTSTAGRRAVDHERREQATALVSWWVSRMLAVGQPFGERLTFAWHAVFATSVTKVRSAAMMAGQNELLPTQGRGDFRTLALAALVDPALLVWLDGETNTATAPNENLSREFMELFTLGHGDGYTETDVREAARALTGWKVDRTAGTSFLDTGSHDAGSKTVLGVTGDLDRTGFCDAVLARPASGPFVLGRLWNQLVSDRAPDPATAATALAAYGPGRDVGAALAAMLTAPGFAAARGSRVVPPVEWTVGLARAVGVRPDDTAAVTTLVATMTALGQVPFAPPSVGGWPGGQAWLSTSGVDTRMQAAAAIVAAGDVGVVANSPAPDRVDTVAHLLGVGAWSPRSRAALTAAGTDPVTLVAAAASIPEYLTV